VIDDFLKGWLYVNLIGRLLISESIEFWAQYLYSEIIKQMSCSFILRAYLLLDTLIYSFRSTNLRRNKSLILLSSQESL
jgi:hypothetical protein